MILTSIHINNFRNFGSKSVAIHPFLTIIIGENARGKTNLLESMYVSLYGAGFREWKEEELLRWNHASSTIETRWQEKDEKSLFYINIEKKDSGVNKKFAVNKVKKTHLQYEEYQTKAVLFAPEHIEIITGSPDNRRSYLNTIISSSDYEYKKRIRNYEHALRKRNKVLERYKSEELLKDELEFWNTYLEEQAQYVTSARARYIDYLNSHARVEGRQFKAEYIKNEFTKSRLKEVYEEEKRWRKTQIGPQKDDIVIYLDKETSQNVQHFGSRSEQRMAVFWLKLNELSFFEETFKKRPILLLDDIFSELDIKNKALILTLIKNYQTILTTTEVELLELTEMPKSIIKL